MICVWRAHIEGHAGAKELEQLSGVASGVAWLPLPRKHGGRCMHTPCVVVCRVTLRNTKTQPPRLGELRETVARLA